MRVVESERSVWCILRTQSSQTLVLAEALKSEGFMAWTPTEVIVRHARRERPRSEVVVALMPGIVFAAWDRLNDLAGLSHSSLTYRRWDADLRRMIMVGLPHFRVMKVGDKPARVIDAELSGLRSAERTSAVLAKKRTFKPGDQVRLCEGAFEGLRGVIGKIVGDFAEVSFPDWAVPVKVAFRLLEAVPAVVAVQAGGIDKRR